MTTEKAETRTELFATRIKRLRLGTRLSLKDMANRLGVPVSTYREWEYGRTIRGQPYMRMAEVLGVSVLELLTGKTPSNQSVFKEIKTIEKHLAMLKMELESFLTNE